MVDSLTIMVTTLLVVMMVVMMVVTVLVMVLIVVMMLVVMAMAASVLRQWVSRWTRSTWTGEVVLMFYLMMAVSLMQCNLKYGGQCQVTCYKKEPMLAIH